MAKKKYVKKGDGIQDTAKQTTRAPRREDGEFEKIMSFSQVAEKLNMSRQTVANYVNGGWIPFVFGVNGIPHIYEADLIESIEAAQRQFANRGQKSRF